MHNSGGKNRKNPPENTNFLPLFSSISKPFELPERLHSSLDNDAALRNFKTIRKMCALRNE